MNDARTMASRLRWRQRRNSQLLGDYGGPSFVFAILAAMNCMVNFDSSGTAAVLQELSLGCPESNAPEEVKERHPCLRGVDQGVLGAMPYIGLCAGCPFAGLLLASRSEKQVVVIALASNAVATMLFACTIYKHWMIAAKFLMGFTQSPIAIYAPVWVSYFAPASHRTLWYGIMQGSVALGSLVGYAACGYLVSFGVYYQVGFQLQAVSVALICAGLYVVPFWRIDSAKVVCTDDTLLSHQRTDAVSSYFGRSAFLHKQSLMERDLDARHVRSTSAVGQTDGAQREAALHLSHSRSAPASSSWPEDRVRLPSVAGDIQGACRVHPPEQPSPPTPPRAARSWAGVLTSTWPMLVVLARNQIYMSTTVSICGLYFVVSGMQYWSSKYFLECFERLKAEVTTSFVSSAATAPILGILVGSTVIDRIGRVDDASKAKTISMVLALWCSVCVLAGILAAGVEPLPRGSYQASMRFYSVVGCIWMILFFGGAMLPAAAGLGLAVVPEKLRSPAAAWATVAKNIFGFALGSLMPGLVSAYTSAAGEDVDGSSRHKELRLGMQVVFLFPIATMASFIWTFLAARAAAAHAAAEVDRHQHLLRASNTTSVPRISSGHPGSHEVELANGPAP